MSSRRHGQQQWLHYAGGSCGGREKSPNTTHHKSSACCCPGNAGSQMMTVCTAGPQGAVGASISADAAYLGRETMPFSASGVGLTFDSDQVPLFFANVAVPVQASNLDPTGGVAFGSSAFVTNKPQRVTALHVNFENLALGAGVTAASIAVYYRLNGDVNLSPPIAVVDLFALDVNEHGFVELAPGVDLPEGTQVSVGIAIDGAVPPVTIAFNAVSAGIRL